MARPSDRIVALETLLGRVRRAGACLLDYEMWSDRGRSSSTEEEIAARESEATSARHESEEAIAALEALVATTRVEAPNEIRDWVAAHDVYLRVYIAAGTELPFAQEARDRWAEVGSGGRAYVEATGGMTEEDPANASRYRMLFGVDPWTLERVGVPIPDWYLHFRPLPSRVVTVEACARALEAVAKEPAKIAYGETQGNPRDYYGRSVTVTAGAALSMWLTQSMLTSDDPNPETSLGAVAVQDTPTTTFASKLATWSALAESFAGVGCEDVTLASSPAPIVDEAMAIGELETAARLRKAITDALVAEVATQRMIALRATRPSDIEAVLAAYPAPLANGWTSFYDCGLEALPTGLARFGGEIDTLILQEPRLGARGIEGVVLPNVVRLDLSGSGIRVLSRENLACFPNLVELILETTRLEILSDDVFAACPKLTSVRIAGTPFGRRTADLAALRSRWPNVTKWE